MRFASIFQMGTNADQHKRSKYVVIHLDGGASHFDIDALSKGIKTRPLRPTNLPPGIFFTSNPGFPGLSGNCKSGEFSPRPRMGVGWQSGSACSVSCGTLRAFY